MDYIYLKYNLIMKTFFKSFLLFWMIPAMSYAACLPLYDHQFNTLQGDKINLCDYQAKPILVVNTASKCGFTPQFNALEAVYKKYHDNCLLYTSPSPRDS